MKALTCIIALLLSGCAPKHDQWASYRYMMQEVAQEYKIPWTRRGQIEIFEDGSAWIGTGNGWEDMETGEKIAIDN